MEPSVKELIEKRAYHLFLKRGGIHGYSMQDWVQAEKEIMSELAAQKKAEVKQQPPKAPAAPVSAAPVAPKPAQVSGSPAMSGKKVKRVK